MDDYLNALLIAGLPAIGIVIGSLLAEIMTLSNRTLSLALHAATGVILGAIAVELMPQALRAEPPWIIVLCFVLGGGFSLLLDHLTDFITSRVGGEERKGPWALFLAVSAELFSDGLMVGAGSTVGLGLGLLLGLAQTPGNIPEGFATTASLRNRNVPRRKRLLITGAFIVPIFLGATIGYWAVRGRPEIVQLGLLAFIAGLLLTIAIEEIVPQSHEGTENHLASALLIAGFALFTLLSVYFD